MTDRRAVPEWIGKTPDTPAPPRVRVRVFDRHGGHCCLSGRKIAAGEPWEIEHIIAIVNGGENRESNLVPVLADKHRTKTAADVAEKSAIYQKRRKHLGVKKRSKWPSRPFPKRQRT